MKNKMLKQALVKLNQLESLKSDDMSVITALSANAIKGGLDAAPFECGTFKCPGSFTCQTTFTVH